MYNKQKEKGGTYHYGLGHGGFKRVAKVHQPPLVVSEQRILLATLQQHGLADCRLFETRRTAVTTHRFSGRSFSAPLLTHLPTLYLVAEFHVGLASHLLQFVLTFENPVPFVGAVVEHHWLQTQTKCCSKAPKQLAYCRLETGVTIYFRDAIENNFKYRR